MAKSFKDALTLGLRGSSVRAPGDVIKDLATALNQEVRSVQGLSFVVRSRPVGIDGRVTHSLRGSLEPINYAAELLVLSHDVLRIYPARISGAILASSQELATEDDLFNTLVQAVNSDRGKEIIRNLIAQAG